MMPSVTCSPIRVSNIGKQMIRTMCNVGIALLMLISSAWAEDVLLELRPKNEDPLWGLVYQEKIEFTPSIAGDKYTFKLALAKAATVTLDVLSADGDVVRTLLDEKLTQPGQHNIVWDGKDDLGIVVPDEVYTPRVRMHAGKTNYIDDPRLYSGGEILKNLEWTTTEKTLSYSLPEPARVLIRTGVKDGPMMRVLKHWEPSNAGTSVTRWDGYDKDQVEYFADNPRRWSIVMAYQIPAYAVITTGNNTLDYRQYRIQRGWPVPEFDLSEFQLQRSGVRLSKDYFLPRRFQPQVEVTLDQDLPVNRIGLPVVSDSMRLTIDVPVEDRWILDASFYETSFYLDYQFASEEEQGFVPMVWDVDVSQLAPGRHIATVQLFGFGGFIISDTVAFWVE